MTPTRPVLPGAAPPAGAARSDRAGSGAVRVVVLASGEGTLAQALLDAAGAPFTVVAVGADRDGALALDRARRAGVPSFAVRPRDHRDRAAWEDALVDAVAAHDPAVVVLAGFMRLLGPAFLDRWPSRVLNAHPSLLPAFPGPRAVADALAAGASTTGASVIVVDAGVDTGPVLAQRAVPVERGDTVATLHERIKVVERALLLDAVTTTAHALLPEGTPR